MEMHEIYNLKNDLEFISSVQEATLDKNGDFGLKVIDGVLFGTDDWFEAIKNGKIPSFTLVGVITRVYMSGHNDFAQFEVTADNQKTDWQRKGVDNAYKEGKNITLTYVEQEFKKPLISSRTSGKIILTIAVEV